MIRPADLENRVIRDAPATRVADPTPPEGEDEHDRSTPHDPCPPSVPASVEHGERTGGNPDLGGE